MKKLIGAVYRVEEAQWRDCIYSNTTSNGIINYDDIFTDFAKMEKDEFLTYWEHCYRGTLKVEDWYDVVHQSYTLYAEAEEILEATNKLLEDIFDGDSME